MTSQLIALSQSFASYFMPGLTALSSLLHLEWKAFIWDLGPHIREYSHIHSNKKLAIHFLSVTWEFLITEWFFAAICYSSIKQIIYSEVIKITKKQENVSNVRAALCMISTNRETVPPWKHFYFEVPTGLTALSARTGCVTLGKGGFCELWECSRMWDWWVQLWLQFSKALKSHWLCFSETHLWFAESQWLNCTWDWAQW